MELWILGFNWPETCLLLLGAVPILTITGYLMAACAHATIDAAGRKADRILLGLKKEEQN